MTGAITALLVASSSKSTSSSGGTTFIIFLVLIAFVGYFLLIRPQKQKARRQREQQSSIGVGDEIVTVGGIIGHVTAVEADRVTILSGGDTVGFAAVGSEPTRLVLVRNAIARKVDPPSVPEQDEDHTGEHTGVDGLEYGSHFDGDGHDGASGTNGSSSGDDRSAEGAENEGTSP